jgi:UPF0716 protein FxsA
LARYSAAKGNKMRFLIIGLLIGFPLAEGALLYRLATGPEGHGGWVLAWLVFAVMAGVVLIKQARFSLIARLTSALSQGQFSLAAFIDSFRTVIAGLLLIFPGLISDVMAMILLLIPVREPAFINAQQTRAAGQSRNASPERAADILEGEFRREP